MSQNQQRDATSHEDEAMLQRCQDLLGWQIITSPDGATLRAGDRVCAADLPVGLAGEVRAMLRLRMLDGPVVSVPGRQHRWMLLATPPAENPVPPRPVPGVDLRVITEGLIALPPSITAHGPLQWVVAPSLSRPWLPPLSAVVAAVRGAVSVG